MKQLLGFSIALCSIVMLNVLNYYPKAHNITSLRDITAFATKTLPAQWLIFILLLVGINLMFSNSERIWMVVVLMAVAGALAKPIGAYINYSNITPTRGELIALALACVSAVIAKVVK